MKLSLSPHQEALPDTHLKDAMRHLTGGVCVITAGLGSRRTGLTVTTATSLSLDPATMLIQVNRSSSSYAVIHYYAHFCVNILADYHQAIAERFTGKNGERGTERYDGAQWSSLSTGALALDGAVANIDCAVEEILDRHSHAIILGRVVDVRLGNAEARQLIYQRGAYGGHP